MLGTSRYIFFRGVGLVSLLVIVMILVVSLSAVAAPMPQDITQPTPVPTPVPPLLTRYLPIVHRRPALPDPPSPPSVVTSAADAQILQGYPAVNYGKTNRMWAGYDTFLDPDGLIARSMVRFNLSTIPSQSTIISASLRLRLMGTYDFAGATRLITTYRVTESWNESTVTWDTAPGYAEAYGSAVIGHGEGVFGWYSFPVTSLVQAWIDGTHINHGFMVRGPEQSGASWRSFSTREGEHPPRLEISYVGPTGAPVTVTLEAAPSSADDATSVEPDLNDVMRCHDAQPNQPCLLQP